MSKSKKIDENGVPGPTRALGTEKVQKSGLDLVWIWLLFGSILRHFGRCFLMCFLDASFSVPGRHVGAQGSRNDAKMRPKVNKRMICSHLVEGVKSMAGTVREPHGEVPRRAQESLFSGLISRRRSGEVGIRFFQILRILGSILEALGMTFRYQNSVCF